MPGVTVTTPDFTGTVNQEFFIEPLGGPQNPITYLDRFPDTVYNKTIDSHLVRFMYALLGPAGVGWLRKNALQARLIFEASGLQTGDLDSFYGNPLKFGRILEEQFPTDPEGLLTYQQWDAIRTKDTQYRNRAIQFMNAARAGNTLTGMTFAAKSGLGHDAEIIENYRALFDQFTDDPLGLPYFGSTRSTEEIIVLPRDETPQNASQTIQIVGTPTAGYFELFIPLGAPARSTTALLAYNTTWDAVQLALEALPVIGKNNVIVSGGPFPYNPITIVFTGKLANQPISTIQVLTGSLSFLAGSNPSSYGGISDSPNTGVSATVTVNSAGFSADGSLQSVAPIDQHYLQQAMDRIRPMTCIVTLTQASGGTQRQVWNTAFSDSTFTRVVQYVTGNNGTPWPAKDALHWVEGGVEHEAPRHAGDVPHHYQGFHNIPSIIAYTDGALNDAGYGNDSWPSVQANYANSHIGGFNQFQTSLFPFLGTYNNPNVQWTPDLAVADPVTPQSISFQASDGTSIINGIYPVDYADLVSTTPQQANNFWSSIERVTGDDYLEIDLGRVQPVNYLSFEITEKPYNITVAYDLLDQAPQRVFQDVTLVDPALAPSITSVGYNPLDLNPWTLAEVHFTNAQGNPVFTRFIRIKLSRRTNTNSPFSAADGTAVPFSVEVRNLRLGRNVS